MASRTIVLLIIGLAFRSLVSCNLEGDVLYTQKQAWKDPNNVLQSWDPTLVNPCTWFHITCNNENTVIRVDLGDAELSGHLVPQLGLLSNLQYLELFGNKITGVIPNSLGNLTKLVSLDLFSNKLSGTIPYTIGNIKSLKFLRLNGNNLTGSIPESVLDLVTTGSLGILNVFNNSLTGTKAASPKRVTTIIQDPKVFTTS